MADETYEVTLSDGSKFHVTTQGGAPSQEQLQGYLKSNPQAAQGSAGQRALRGVGTDLSDATNMVSGVANTIGNTLQKSPKGFDPAKDETVQMLGRFGRGLAGQASAATGLITDTLALPITAGNALINKMQGKPANFELPGFSGGPLRGVLPEAREAAPALVKTYGDRYGSLERAKNSLLDHPLRTGLDAFAVASPVLGEGALLAEGANMPRAAAALRFAAHPVSTPMKAAAEEVGPMLQNGARGLTRRSLGLSVQDTIDKPGARRAISGQLGYGTLPTQGGYDKLEALIADRQGRNDAIFAANPRSMSSTTTAQAPLNDWIAERRQTIRTDPEGLQSAIDVRNDFNTPAGPNQQPVWQLINGQWQQTGTRLPSRIPTASLHADRSRTGAVLNRSYAAGEAVPPAPVIDAKKRLYSGMTDAVHEALPELAPNDAELTWLHSAANQVKKGPLGARTAAQPTTYPGFFAQIGSAIGRQVGNIEAIAGHGFNKAGMRANGYALRPQGLSRFLPQGAAFGSAMDATMDDHDRNGLGSAFDQLRGVRY